MDPTYAGISSGHHPNLIELSDSEEIYSTSEDEPSQQDANNRRLTQAMNYLQREGGDDSPATFIDRVNRIDDALLQGLPQEGQAFDRKLYRQVRALVLNVQRDYEDAAEEDSLQLENDEHVPRYYTPTAFEEALYRGEESSPSPTPNPAATGQVPSSRALAPKHSGSEDNVQREREFKYGGPNNKVENWYKDYPAYLPFPETLMMAHWESLKIDYDLSRTNKETVMETNVPFHHPQLQPYFNLPQYESGSRFKLPTVSKEAQVSISRYGTAVQLEKVVNHFYKQDLAEDRVKDHPPCVFLEKFAVGKQIAPSVHVASPNQIRRSMNTSPSPQTGTIPWKRSSPALIEDCLYDTDNTLAPHPEAGLSASTPRTRPVSVEKSSKTRSSSAFRRISAEVRRSNSTSSIAEPVASTSKPAPTRIATHVAIPKRSRPHKNPLPVEVIPDTPIPSSTLGKRKPSDGSQPYTPPKSSLKKVLRDAKRQKTTPQKNVGFVDTLEEDSDDPNYSASPVARPVRNVGNKATKAGKQARKGKGKEVSARTTRSGATYLK